MAFCYILFSQNLNKYYIGANSDKPSIRLEKHLNKSYGKDTYTAKADDWIIFIVIECKSMKQATNIESHIKRMKSRKYIENLKRYPGIIEKLLLKY